MWEGQQENECVCLKWIPPNKHKNIYAYVFNNVNIRNLNEGRCVSTFSLKKIALPVNLLIFENPLDKGSIFPVSWQNCFDCLEC